MKNQVDLIRASSSHHSIAHVLNSTLAKQQVLNVKQDVINSKTKLLYIAPETFSKNETIDFLNIPPDKKKMLKENMIWCNLQYDKYNEKD